MADYGNIVLRRNAGCAKTVYGLTGAAMTQDDGEKRLDALIKLKRATGLSIDFWEGVCQDLDSQALESMAERAAVSPSYMKSKDT